MSAGIPRTLNRNQKGLSRERTRNLLRIRAQPGYKSLMKFDILQYVEGIIISLTLRQMNAYSLKIRYCAIFSPHSHCERYAYGLYKNIKGINFPHNLVS